MIPLLVEAVPAVGAQVVALPAQNPTPPPGRGEEFGKASPVALVVIIALALVTVLLIRSMSKRIRRLPGSFDPPGAAEQPAQEPGSGSADEQQQEKADGDVRDAGGARP